MTYKPTSDTSRVKITSIILALLAIVLFVASAFVKSFAGFYQISAILCAVISLELYTKYVGSDYIYEAGDSTLKIYRINGKKSTCVCSLDLSMSLSNAVKGEDYEKNKGAFPKTNFNVNYAKNLAPQNYYVYFFEFNGKKTMLKFEPDEVFVNYLNSRIDACTENAQE